MRWCESLLIKLDDAYTIKRPNLSYFHVPSYIAVEQNSHYITACLTKLYMIRETMHVPHDSSIPDES